MNKFVTAIAIGVAVQLIVGKMFSGDGSKSAGGTRKTSADDLTNLVTPAERERMKPIFESMNDSERSIMKKALLVMKSGKKPDNRLREQVTIVTNKYGIWT